VTRSRSLAFLLIVATLGVAGWFYHAYAQRHPSTSDAYVGMHIVRIAAQVSGPVATVAVHSHEPVKQGQLLLTIDPAPFELALQKAQARLQQAEDALAAGDAQVSAAQAKVHAADATLQEVRSHSARILDLVSKGTASKDEGDSAQRALKDARDSLAAAKAELAVALAQRGGNGDANAAVKSAQASVAQARLDLQHTRIVAPADGVLSTLDLRPGGYIAEGQGLFALVETGEVWVDANFKETDLPRIKPGQPAEVTVDLQPGKTFKGRVESLSPASGTAFSLLPPENATGNWVKVTQRFPVRVRILDPQPGLRVGGSSEVTVDTTRNDNGN
jgi:membrane fusion protein, multidrug efflux system